MSEAQMPGRRIGPVVLDLKNISLSFGGVKALTDINSREFLVLAVLALAVLYMGVYPKPFTDVMDASVAELLRHVAISKLN